MAAYIGVYESPSMGRVYIGSTGDGLVVSIGVMSATAEPFTAPNSLRVELIPLRGEVLTFGGTDQLTYGGVVFERRQP